MTMSNEAAPSCSHGKTVLKTTVKEGPNKGRQFYSCPAPSNERCKFFKWFDELTKQTDSSTTETSTTSSTGAKKRPALQYMAPSSLDDATLKKLRSSGVKIYVSCEMIKSSGGAGGGVEGGMQRFLQSNNRQNGGNGGGDDDDERSSLANSSRSRWASQSAAASQAKLFLKIDLGLYKESSSEYAKDDIWIVSSSPSFSNRSPKMCLLARSVFHGLSSRYWRKGG
jgi:hypothetical protein